MCCNGCETFKMIMRKMSSSGGCGCCQRAEQRVSISCSCEKSEYFVIRNQRSGLVLDGEDYEVKVQHFAGSGSQLWRLESLSPGKFLIVNKANGLALDIEGGAHKGRNLITFEKHGRDNQQWFINSDGTIAGPSNLAIDISTQEETISAGDSVIAYPKHGRANQVFKLQCRC